MVWVSSLPVSFGVVPACGVCRLREAGGQGWEGLP